MNQLPLSDELQQRLSKVRGTDPLPFIYVSIATQTLQVFSHGSISKTYTISTSKYGIGNKEGSLQTPTGIHQIVEKIGADAPLGAIFRDRIFTGIIWSPSVGYEEENSILSRILRLTGLEPGINAGPGIDTYERYVYIHGTNKEQSIGTPLSHGCVVMKNSDIIELFETVSEGMIVIISEN